MPRKYRAKAPTDFYCHDCGWGMAWIKRTAHLQGKPHQAWLRQPFWTAVHAHAESLRTDKSFTSVDVSWRILTLVNGQTWSVAVTAKDDLGNYTVVRVDTQAMKPAAFVHQIYPQEVASWGRSRRGGGVEQVSAP